MTGRGYYREPNEPTPEEKAEIESRTAAVLAEKLRRGPNYQTKDGRAAPKASKPVVPRKRF